ncbi:MAG: benzoyl-CoA reductase subunit A [Planctomycetes bacterium]|nr:benzoyl-CoA reductase subunit A [Planctomycetota bacterium]
MRCVVGIDLGSTTTKAVLLDESGGTVGRGITNSRSNYEVASAVARDEALTAARFHRLERALGATGREAPALGPALREAFRLELHLDQIEGLGEEIARQLATPLYAQHARELGRPLAEVMDLARAEAPGLFRDGAERRSDFFRDLAGAAFLSGAERIARRDGLPFERMLGIFDRAILEVEARPAHRDFGRLLHRAASRVAPTTTPAADGRPPGNGARGRLLEEVARAAAEPILEVAFVGTGYGRSTLPFPREAVRSEILCHGRGAHRVFPGTRTVLDIGGQDTKAIQVDAQGVVSTFQMNDRCAAGCGRYLGYIADELNLGLHELGPLALKARRSVKVNSTCTVFAGAELRERLALGQDRSDILAGLHRAIMLRAMSLLARSGGVSDEFTFTGGVSKNVMATRVLRELVVQHYGEGITLNAHPDSIYMGALGAALYALDDVREGRPSVLPTFMPREDGRGG